MSSNNGPSTPPAPAYTLMQTEMRDLVEGLGKHEVLKPCNHKFQEPLELEKVMAHGSPNEEEHYDCSKCGHRFQNLSSFNVHLIKNHRKTPTTFWVCKFCTRKAYTKSDHKRHLRDNHKCGECNKYFHSP